MVNTGEGVSVRKVDDYGDNHYPFLGVIDDYVRTKGKSPREDKANLNILLGK